MVPIEFSPSLCASDESQTLDDFLPFYHIFYCYDRDGKKSFHGLERGDENIYTHPLN